MGRKTKLVNKSDIPQYVVERFARCVFDDIRADYAKPEIQAEFQRWLAEREQNKKARASDLEDMVWYTGRDSDSLRSALWAITRLHSACGR